MRPLRALLARALCLTVLLALGSRAEADGPYEIAAILSLTGSGSYVGQENATGLRLVETKVNAAGGIRGRAVKFVVKDDQSSPQIAVQLLNETLRAKPSVVIGSSLVSACNAMAPLVASGPVLYCLSAGYYPPKGSYTFAYGIPTSALIRVFVRYFRERGWHRIGAVFTTDATGQDGERSLTGALALPENASVQMVDLEHYAPNDVSVGAQVARVKGAAPQVVLVWASGTPLGTVLHAATDLGLNLPLGVPGSNLNYNEMQQFADILPPEILMVSVPGLSPDVVPNGPVRTAVLAYVGAVKAAGITGDANFINGYDPGSIVVSALRQLGLDASPEAIKRYIENLHGFYGAGGEYDFRDGSQRGLNADSAAVVRWDAATKHFAAASKLGGAPITGK